MVYNRRNILCNIYNILYDTCIYCIYYTIDTYIYKRRAKIRYGMCSFFFLHISDSDLIQIPIDIRT
jgi:hypothetical protein